MLPLGSANGSESSRYDAIVEALSAVIVKSPLEPSGRTEN